MKTSILFFVLATLFILNSCGSYSKKVSSDFEPQECTVELKENEQVSLVDFKNSTFPMSLVWFKGYERTFIKVNDNFFLIEVDWIFEENEFSPDLSIISLFKHDDAYILMFPTYTEEFPVFGLVNISKNGTFEDLGFHTYNYADFEKAKDEMLDGSYLLGERNDTVRVLLDTDPKVLLSDLMYFTHSTDPISENEKTMLQSLVSN